ncbi:hypothetical protein ACWC9H_15085 [Streptomyces sp. NPDC001251]|uniref:hypothetical protein n=1 Tax=unclassified Streptomyces TaxID=2593676 RepID=UPI0035DE6BC6
MTEKAELDALATVLTEAPPVSLGWTDALWDLYEAYEESRARGGPLPDLNADQSARFQLQWRRQELSGRAYRLVGKLQERAERGSLAAPATAADISLRLARAGLVAHDAINLLYALGVPHGESGLLALAHDREISEGDRIWAREWLFALRRDGYRARGEMASEGEEPLLPEAVRRLPVDIGGAVALSVALDLAQAALKALLPPTKLSSPEPPPEWTAGWDEPDEQDEYRPDWLEVRLLVMTLMPDPQRTTRERMSEAKRECEVLGLDGGDGDFTELWTTRIAAWLAGGVFDALGRSADCAALRPWAMDLAEQYVRRGMAAEEARTFLWRASDTVPYASDVLGRLPA